MLEMLTNHLFCVLPKAGWTGVLLAARRRFADIVRELITKYGCDRNAVHGVSETCLQPEEHCQCGSQLNGMHVHVLQGGLNALHLAAIGNHVEVVKLLVGEFALSVTHRDNVSCTSKRAVVV